MPSFQLSSRVNWFESSSEAGSTPVHISASNSHIGIVELVFGEGSSTDHGNMPPLHVTAKGGYTGLAEQLLGSTLPKGHTGVMELFSKDASINTMDEDENTPLQLAIMHGHTDMVDLLLSKGASIGARDH